MQGQLHDIHTLVFHVMKRLMKSHRDVTLAWLATLLSMNEMRTAVTPQVQPAGRGSVQVACTDGTPGCIHSFRLDITQDLFAAVTRSVLF